MVDGLLSEPEVLGSDPSVVFTLKKFNVKNLRQGVLTIKAALITFQLNSKSLWKAVIILQVVFTRYCCFLSKQHTGKW